MVYPEEIKQEVRNSVSNGLSKIDTSIKFRIPYYTIKDWTRDIKSNYHHYPVELKRQVRNLVRKGVTKSDVARITGLRFVTVSYFTKDIKTRRGNTGLRGKSLEFMKLLVQRGYIISDEVKQLVPCMRTIMKYFPVKKVRFRQRTIWYLPGKEREAMQFFLEKSYKHSLTYNRLNLIRKAFGITEKN